MIIYQVLPRLFRNGKFSGFDSRAFAYLKTLGVTHVWYTGIPRHATAKPFVKGDPGSPYAITDWYDVNSYLADDPTSRMEEFEALVARTHSSGLKVITDFIPNHVAPDNVNGIPDCGRCDFDWTDTLKVDYSAPGCIGKMIEVVRFWALRGVDGVRCDMVELVGPEVFTRIISEIKEEFPEFIFIGEVYETSGYDAYANRAGFDYLYDKSGLYDTLRNILTEDGSVRQLTWNWQRVGGLQPRMLGFLENHDEQRLASPQFAGCPEKGYAALAAASLWSTAPFMLYFGQELGESAPDGADGRTSIFSWARRTDPLEYPAAGSEVLKRYRQILGAAATPLFTEGKNWDLCYCQPSTNGFKPEKHWVFVRYFAQPPKNSEEVSLNCGCQASLVFCNFSADEAEVTVILPEELLRMLPAEVSERWQNGVPIQAAGYDANMVSLIGQNY